jgi:hypothetical protein
MRWRLFYLLVWIIGTTSVLAQDNTLQILTEGRTTVEISPEFDEAQSENLADQLTTFEAQLSPLEIGLVISRWSEDGELWYRVRHNDTEPYAVASVFKPFAAYAYFLQTPQAEWQTEPDSDVYNMVVYSNNAATADVLASLADHIPGDSNPIQKFNDFMVATFGISPRSGIFKWNFGQTAGNRDRRYAPIPTTAEGFVDVRGRRIPVENRYTAADLAHALEFIAQLPYNPDATPEMRAAYDATRALMITVVPNRTAAIDSLLNVPGIWRKTGFVDASEIGAEANSEVIVIPAQDGGHFVIAIISTGENNAIFKDALAFALTQIAAFDTALPTSP